MRPCRTNCELPNAFKRATDNYPMCKRATDNYPMSKRATDKPNAFKRDATSSYDKSTIIFSYDKHCLLFNH